MVEQVQGVQSQGRGAEMPVNEQPQARANSVPLQLMFKNRLQEYTQKSAIPLPIYQTVNQGAQHVPKFRSTVLVDGVHYTSQKTFSNRKAAEQDAAKLALDGIAKKLKEEGCPIIHEDTVFCKSILNEYAVKLNMEMPTYKTTQPEGLLPVFVSSLVFDGVSYTGEAGRSKKEAEQLAARVVIISILSNSDTRTVISEIINSKHKLYAALHRVKDNAGNTGTDLIIHPSKGKSVENNDCNVIIPSTAIPDTCLGQLNIVSAMNQPCHKVSDLHNTHTVQTDLVIEPSKEKSVEVNECTQNVASTAIPDNCSGQVNILPAMNQTCHEVEDLQNTHIAGTGSAIHLSKRELAKVTECAESIPSATIQNMCSGQLNVVPAVDQPCHNVKDLLNTQITGTDSGIHLGKGKSVAVIDCEENIVSAAIPDTCSGQLNFAPAVIQPGHEFKKPKLEPSSETSTAPILFAPMDLERPPCPGLRSAKKRNRKKKKKKANNQAPYAQLPAAALPSSQAPSVTQ